MAEDASGGVVVHTSNPNDYNEPDEVQARMMPGRLGTVIPRATERGGSTGAPITVMHIDPVNPLTGEGGITVDLSDSSNTAKRNAAIKRAHEMTDDPQDAAITAFKFIEEIQQVEGTPQEEVEKVTTPAEIIPDIVEQVVELPQTTSTTDLSAIVAQQNQMLGVMSQMMQELKSEKAAPVSEPSIEEEEEIVTEDRIIETPVEAEIKTSEEMMTKRQAVDLLQGSFEELKIPGLQPIAAKPKFRVIFHLGDAGTHTAWYHWVGTHNKGLFLIYDTRFEYGMQYTPPNLGPNRSFKIEIPDNNATYAVYSLDFVHPFGVFEIVNLVIADEDDSSSLDSTVNNIIHSEYDEYDEDLLKHIM
jgi:hypothetical protein